MGDLDGKKTANEDRQMAVLADMIRTIVREELGAVARQEVALLDVDEAARRLGLSTSTVYKRAEKCELPSVKIGIRVLFRAADLDAYAEARRRSPERVRKLATGEP